MLPVATILTIIEVYSPTLMVSPSERKEGIWGRSLVPFKKVPFEESRSERTHLAESGSKWMERCLEEMPESLMVSELPRTTRPECICRQTKARKKKRR